MTETQKKKRYWYRPDGYETDHLIDSLSDEELLDHMGVPLKYIRHAVAMQNDLPDEVESWLANMPYVYRPTFDRLDKDMCGVGLVFWGEPGGRKTTVAAATLLRAVRLKTPNTDPTGHNYTWHGAAMGRFVDWQEASALFRSASRSEEDEMAAEEVKKFMKPNGPAVHRADFLILDDISRERATEFNITELQRTLRRRGDNGYPTILTSNRHPDDWEEAHGDALSGYIHRQFLPVEFAL
jgi:hypothetical protein